MSTERSMTPVVVVTDEHMTRNENAKRKSTVPVNDSSGRKQERFGLAHVWRLYKLYWVSMYVTRWYFMFNIWYPPFNDRKTKNEQKDF